jgi:molecular chaperone DnaK (HSP70)
MAGNATCVPLVQKAIEGLFGKEKIRRNVHPKKRVAMGAAILAAAYAMVQCPKCSKENDLNRDSCECCGTPLGAAANIKKCLACGEDNDKESKQCKKCGAPFIVLNKEDIAPFSYGIKTVGDEFNQFIAKGDSYETPEEKRIVHTLYTRFPNQRIITLPIYGGNDLTKASNNTKQSAVFIIIPSEMPEGTPVKVKAWLDHNGEAAVDVFMEDGTHLEGVILRGNVDQKAMDIFMETEIELFQKKDNLTVMQKDEIGQIRNDFLSKLEAKDFQEAVEKAEVLRDKLKKVGEAEDPLKTTVQGTIGYITYLVNQYGWLID